MPEFSFWLCLWECQAAQELHGDSIFLRPQPRRGDLDGKVNRPRSDTSRIEQQKLQVPSSLPLFFFPNVELFPSKPRSRDWPHLQRMTFVFASVYLLEGCAVGSPIIPSAQGEK